MALQIFYILTTAPLIFSQLSLASDNNTIDYDYSGVEIENRIFPCESDKECEIMKYQKCIDAFCSCREGTDCSQKVRVFTLGESCNDKNVTCAIYNAHCSNGTCVCNENHIESETKKDCLKAYRKLGESCVENRQCFTQYCRSNICIKTSALGDKCFSDKQCKDTIEFSQCAYGKCRCLDRYVAHEGKCYLASRDLLSPCEVHTQCTRILGKAAECVEEKCVCPDGFTYESFAKRCVLNVVESSASFKWITFKVIAFSVFIVHVVL